VWWVIAEETRAMLGGGAWVGGVNVVFRKDIAKFRIGGHSL
jgi:hypothetical protein